MPRVLLLSLSAVTVPNEGVAGLGPQLHQVVRDLLRTGTGRPGLPPVPERHDPRRQQRYRAGMVPGCWWVVLALAFPAGAGREP